ncbi:kinase-like domain-containing protein [Mycena floridula]|nr:kinase-like domain-containing protein [Mycena floridula]
MLDEISDIKVLRSALHQPYVLDTILKELNPSIPWLTALAELLHHETKYIFSTDTQYKRRCLQTLQRLAKQHGILPPSILIHNVSRISMDPVAGGGFAEVYQGSLHGNLVCLKRLRFFTQTLDMREKVKKDCYREAIIWKQLDHPNILPFFGVSEDIFPPSLCLISPWISNGNLIDYIRTHPDFDLLNAVRDIAAAMQYLHEYTPAIVHADIRGANILVLDNQQCCLADFGLSVVTESLSVANSSTSRCDGSVRWMAPEVLSPTIHGKEAKQIPRDIYAFACTVFEVYTKTLPFCHCFNDIQVAKAVLEGQRPERPSNVFSDYMWELVESCWQQKPELRPSACIILRRLSEQYDIDAVPSSPSPLGRINIHNVIEDYVADVRAHNIDDAAIRTILTGYLFERSTNTTEFICQISGRLKIHPNLIRQVNIVLQVSGVRQRIEVITSDDDGTAELIVITSPAGAQIHALSPDIMQPLGLEIASARALRVAIRLGSLDSILTNTNPKPTWLRVLAELLQYEIVSP